MIVQVLTRSRLPRLALMFTLTIECTLNKALFSVLAMDPIKINLKCGVQRETLFSVWQDETNVDKKTNAVLSFLMQKSDFLEYEEDFKHFIKKTIENFCSQLMLKWKKCHRIKNLFISKNEKWLGEKIVFKGLPSKKTLSRPGRPEKSFASCSDSVKRRKVRPLLQTFTQDELTYASRVSLRQSGKRDAAYIIKQVSSLSPKRVTKIKKMCSTDSPSQLLPTKITAEKALALYVNSKMTKKQYIAVQQMSKSHNANIYPNYNALLLAKKQCYPNEITISEISAEVKLQSLVEHTIRRLLSVQNEVLEHITNSGSTIKKMNIYFKWGCDGAAGQSCYKQIFEHEENDDSFLFSISIVPLRIIAVIEDKQEFVIWQNESTSSTKYCRPVKIIFHKETKEFVKNEIENIKKQIDELSPITTEFQRNPISCYSFFSLTMIDGKICSWLSDTPGQNCHLCGASPKQMNDIDVVLKKLIREDNLEYGISSLHAWIKTFECILHIAYRLEICKWQVRKEDKGKVETRKKEIQEKFRRNMGLLVDMPKPGFGTTNDGNTARRFFRNPELASEITGVNEEFIKRISTILITISCGFEVDSVLFKSYCIDTAKIYVNLYPWYYMPQSLHKILIHGADLINKSVLPIGQMSEEVQESRNKDSKQYREFFSRKFTRQQTLEDMMHMLLVSSDPLISSLRPSQPKKGNTLPSEVKKMIKCVNTNSLSDNSESESCNSDDDNN